MKEVKFYQDSKILKNIKNIIKTECLETIKVEENVYSAMGDDFISVKGEKEEMEMFIDVARMIGMYFF